MSNYLICSAKHKLAAFHLAPTLRTVASFYETDVAKCVRLLQYLLYARPCQEFAKHVERNQFSSLISLTVEFLSSTWALRERSVQCLLAKLFPDAKRTQLQFASRKASTSVLKTLTSQSQLPFLVQKKPLGASRVFGSEQSFNAIVHPDEQIKRLSALPHFQPNTDIFPLSNQPRYLSSDPTSWSQHYEPKVNSRKFAWYRRDMRPFYVFERDDARAANGSASCLLRGFPERIVVIKNINMRLVSPYSGNGLGSPKQPVSRRHIDFSAPQVL
ncbi:hypothetical protein SCHPADRAFT_945572 [Schizopora paradoxa]|uniref:Uncharacterized protein n=1 Tax=Schizopora paradoxa TaxID=27342 RepID=A0A0H2RC77_9AGAM|nr:hypothetical protein SCHPADRAFT_945572 [Schizopora paradoxa]